MTRSDRQHWFHLFIYISLWAAIAPPVMPSCEEGGVFQHFTALQSLLNYKTLINRDKNNTGRSTLHCRIYTCLFPGALRARHANVNRPSQHGLRWGEQCSKNENNVGEPCWKYTVGWE
jgi:hypothetical protein